MRPEEIILEPILSEKAYRLREQNQYLFKVHKDANKTEIKKAIEKIFKVKVKKVRIIKVKPKKRILRGKVGFKPSYKKAIVTLEKDQKIEIG